MPATLSLMLLAATAQSPVAQYTVHIDDRLTAATVEAVLPAETTRILMDSVQAEQLPRGWATFVTALEVRAAGKVVNVVTGTGAEWQLPPGTRGPLNLRYRIDLSFARAHWPAGNEQAGAVFPNALYLVGRPLFIVSDHPASARVTFDIPAGWRVSTPLRSAGSDERTFTATNTTELVRNALVVGRHNSIRLTSGSFDFELALPGAAGTAAPLAEPLIRALLPAYHALFPGTPPQKYLMTFFQAADDDGEAFISSASFTSADSISANGVVVWGNFLAHELMHFWNGQRIRGAGARTTWRWLAEGFSEYYANIMMARNGSVSPDLFLKKAERHLGNYLYFATSPARTPMSLVEAGTNTTANRFGVYDGGWTVALCLDGIIRERSGDRRSLDDFMRELWLRFGTTRREYSIADLAALAGELSSSDLTSFFTRFVEGREVLPVRECLSRVGLTGTFKGYAGEAFLFTDSTATSVVQARAQAWSGASRKR